MFGFPVKENLLNTLLFAAAGIPPRIDKTLTANP